MPDESQQKDGRTNVVPLHPSDGYNGEFESEKDQREYDFRTWESDAMESHGVKAAYWSGWRDASEFRKRRPCVRTELLGEAFIMYYEDRSLESIWEFLKENGMDLIHE